MPKTFTIKLEVPSGSRPVGMFRWLNRLLGPHRMKVIELTDDQVTVTVDTPGAEP